jgi:hypothetical protein
MTLIGNISVLAFFAGFTPVAALLYYYRDTSLQWMSGNPRTACIFWLVIISAEYWIAGPFSYMAHGDEAAYSLASLVYSPDKYGDGRFWMGLAGGIDGVAPTNSARANFISLDMLLFSTFPVWIAQAIHKILNFGIAYVGGYFLASAFSENRLIQIICATAYTLMTPYIGFTTMAMGSTYALIPLAIYVIVFRAKSESYFRYGLLLTALAIGTGSFFHGAPPLLISIGLLAIAFRPKQLIKILTMSSILFVALVANSSELVFRLADLDEKFREPLSVKSVSDFISQVDPTVLNPVLALTLVSAFIGAIAYRDRDLLKVSLGYPILVCLIAILLSVPWDKIGVGFLESYSYTYLIAATLGFFIPIAALLLDKVSQNSVQWVRVGFFPILLAGIIGWLSLSKGTTLVFYLINGGVESIVAKRNFDRIPKSSGLSEHRTVTVPYRLVPSMMSIQGHSAFDGRATLINPRIMQFWNLGLNDVEKPDGTPVYNTYAQVGYHYFDYQCCAYIDLKSIVVPDLLRVANVKYMVSLIPLRGDGIKKIAGPSEDAFTPWDKQGQLSKITAGLREIFTPGDAYIYEISDSLPRLFFATSLTAYEAHQIATPPFYREVAKAAMNRGILVPADQLSRLHTSEDVLNSTPRITDVHRHRDDISVNVEAPEGGVLVFNQAWNKFWQVHIDDKPSVAVPVNGIHMAVKIQPGATLVKFSYRRETVPDKLTHLWKSD